jgi:interferon gamma-inducible protein 30
MEKLAPSRCAFLVVVAVALVVALPSVQGVEKVKVELYSESLCPYCAQFIVNYLNPFFNNGLIDIVELRIIPYGNAHVVDGKLVCQHGPDECELNIIQTCSIRLWPKVTDWFPFIYCLETLDRSTAAKNWKSCVHPSHLDLDPLIECSASPLGAKLEMEFAAETDRLQPPHKYVPWVLVNGEPLLDNYEDVAAYVCKAYQGNKPAVCSRLEHKMFNTKQPARVCAKENESLASI